MKRTQGVAIGAIAIIVVLSLIALSGFLLPNPGAPPPPTSTSAQASHSSSGTKTSSSTSSSSLTDRTRVTVSTTTASAGSGSGSITVLGWNLNHTKQVNAIKVELRINGNAVADGGTPVTFSGLQLGVQYGVVIYWYGNYYIRYINDSNTGIDLQRYDLVTLTQSNPTDTLTGMFEYVPPSQAASLNMLAEWANGSELSPSGYNCPYSPNVCYEQHSSGMWLTLTPPGQAIPYTGTFTGGSILPFILFNHSTYTVQMSLSYCGPWTNATGSNIGTVYAQWSHWKDNNSTNANRAITLDGNASYIPVYDQLSKPCPASIMGNTDSFSSSNFGSVTMVVLAVTLPVLARAGRRHLLRYWVLF